MGVQADLEQLHKKSQRNRAQLAQAAVCGCFYCLSEYPFEQITKWTDNGQTAICPVCGIDAVIDFSSATANQELLRSMHERWFGRGKSLTQQEWDNAVETDTWPPRSR
jgi:hypothetical protein